MSTVLAINLAPDTLTLVSAQAESTGPIRITGSKVIELRELQLSQGKPTEGSNTEGDSPSFESGSQSESPESEHPTEKPKRLSLYELMPELIEEESLTTLATVTGKPVLYQYLSLPFNERKKLEQIVPLQVQDQLPFDLDSFVVDTVILGKNTGGQYELLTSVIAENEVRSSLETIASIGANPRVLTSGASAVAALIELFPEELEGSFALLVFSSNTCSLAIFVGGELKHIREIPYHSLQYNSPRDDLTRAALRALADVRCSLMQVEERLAIKLSKAFVLNPPLSLTDISSQLGMDTKALALRDKLELSPGVELAESDLHWVLGLVSSELQLKRKAGVKLVDFRQGEFAYRPGFGNIMTLLKDQGFYIGAAVVMGLIWLISVLATGSAGLGKINSAITNQIQQVMPGESIPELGEVAFLNEKIDKLQEQLRGLGSLSSLSPLEALKEISTAVGPGLDVAIEGISIGHSRISLRGTVADYTTSGKLTSALESRAGRFFKVQLDTKERVAGSSRVKFTAEITLNE